MSDGEVKPEDSSSSSTPSPSSSPSQTSRDERGEGRSLSKEKEIFEKLQNLKFQDVRVFWSDIVAKSVDEGLIQTKFLDGEPSFCLTPEFDAQYKGTAKFIKAEFEIVKLKDDVDSTLSWFRVPVQLPLPTNPPIPPQEPPTASSKGTSSGPSSLDPLMVEGHNRDDLSIKDTTKAGQGNFKSDEDSAPDRPPLPIQVHYTEDSRFTQKITSEIVTQFKATFGKKIQFNSTSEVLAKATQPAQSIVLMVIALGARNDSEVLEALKAFQADMISRAGVRGVVLLGKPPGYETALIPPPNLPPVDFYVIEYETTQDAKHLVQPYHFNDFGKDFGLLPPPSAHPQETVTVQAAPEFKGPIVAPQPEPSVVDRLQALLQKRPWS